jgi:hypothetical protein
MARLGRVITEAIVDEYGRDEFLARLAHPFWFQSFGAVMGMDWHSSGITTSVIGALKRGLEEVRWELGIHVCGGRGRYSRRTPAELLEVGKTRGLDGEDLALRSRLVAKVDSAAVQDGFQLYLHGFIVTDEGNWVVVQQGMNSERRQARRYHWLSSRVTSFVEEPHSAIEGPPRGEIVNLTDRRARPSRDVQVELVRDPDRVVSALQMPSHHEVRRGDVNLRRLRSALAAAARRGPVDFQDLMMTPGVGARTLEALALVAEVIHGAPSRFQDPARFSFAHGGKDGHPFPVPLKVYDETIRVLRGAVERARLGNDDRLAAVRRLDLESRRLENWSELGAAAEGEASFEEITEVRRAQGPALDERSAGRSKWRKALPKTPRQLKLF